MRCEHCFDVIPKSQAVKSDSNGCTLYFCCRACLAVYHLLHQECADELGQACIATHEDLSPNQAAQRQIADGLFRRLFLAIIFTIQTAIFLLASHYWQVLEDNTALFIWLPVIFTAFLMWLLLFSFARQAVSSGGGVQLFSLISGVLVYGLAVQQFWLHDNRLYLGVFAAFSVVLLLLHYLDARWRSIELYLLPVLSIKKMDRWLGYLAYCLLLIALGSSVYCLPKGWEQAYILFLSTLVVANPYILRLTMPLALYSLNKCLRKSEIKLRSLRVLELLAQITAVFVGNGKELQLNDLLVETVNSQDEEEQNLQLRLLQERHKVLLITDHVTNKELFNLADVSAVFADQGTKELEQTADIILADQPLLLAALLVQAKRFKRYIWLFMAAWLICVLLILFLLSQAYIGMIGAFVAFCAIFVFQLISARFSFGRNRVFR